MAEPRAFGYTRGLAPGLWMMVGLGGAELLVTHLLLLRWSHVGALLVSALTLAAVGWLATAVAAMRRRPVLLTDTALVWRLGRLKSITVPRDAVGGVRREWDATAVKRRTVLNLAELSYPNVVVDLTRPVIRRHRAITALAHRLDDPAAFADALTRWRGAIVGCPTAPDHGSRAS